ncbi:uncharacterized protein [Prorops nasuta]|uniref:uncharacterized protein n=1 Tax=Prorops nasuta TaxID=863751 RepID=UPI0034D005BD
MSTNVCIIDLPSELIGFILRYNDISIVHVLNLSITCKKLNDMINEQNVWKQKYFQRWTWMREFYEDYVIFDNTVVCWKKLWEDSLTSIKKLKQLIDSDYLGKNYMSTSMFSGPFTKMWDEKLINLIDTDNGVLPLIIELIVRELKEIDENTVYHYIIDEFDDYNLSTLDKDKRDYIFQIETYMKEIYLTNKWMKLLDLPPERQTLDKSSMLALEWSNQRIEKSNKSWSKYFDRAANNAMLNLKKTYPEHPIFSVSKEKLNFWRENVIEGIQWNYIDGRRIVEALRATLLKSKAGGLSSIEYHREHRFPLYIENLRFSVKLESIARRLGVRCECAIYSNHIFLKWKECCDNVTKSENVYLDLIYGGEFLKETNCDSNGIRIGNYYQIIEDDRDIEEIENIMDRVNKLINDFKILNPKALANVKKCMEIYQNMQASYDKRSILEVAKLKMQVVIIFKSLEKLLMLRQSHNPELTFHIISKIYSILDNMDLRKRTEITL